MASPIIMSPSFDRVAPGIVGDLLYPSRLGAMFSTTHQTPGTNPTGQTAFAATTPTFLIYQAAAVNRVILEQIELTQTGTVAGGAIDIYIAIDTASRYSAAGTPVVPQNMNAESTEAATFTFTHSATASAAGGGTRYIYSRTIAASVGAEPHIIDLQGAGIIGATGSILVYTVAAVTGPTWKFNFRVAQEKI